MKRFFTLVIAAVAALSVNAADLIPTNFNSWDASKCTIDGKTITFSGQWAGCGAWLANDDGGLDLSKYEYVWIELAEPAQGKTKFALQVTADCNSSGDYLIADGGSIIGIDLKEDSKLDKEEFANTYQIVLQCMEDSGNGKVVVKGVYGGTAAEYESAKAGNKQTSTNLDLSNLASGWGDSSYDAATKTITIGTDWSGKGWWLASVDYSDFDQVFVQFDPATEAAGNLVIEYANSTKSTSVGFEAGATNVVADIDPAGKAVVKQIYIQGPAGSTYTLAKAIVATKDVVATGVKTVNASAKAEADAAIYNLAGQKVNKAYKGVVIQNGKKFINK